MDQGYFPFFPVDNGQMPEHSRITIVRDIRRVRIQVYQPIGMGLPVQGRQARRFRRTHPPSWSLHSLWGKDEATDTHGVIQPPEGTAGVAPPLESLFTIFGETSRSRSG